MRITHTITTSNRHDDAHPRLHARDRARDPDSAFEMFLDLLRSMHGPNLLRVKGIVKIAETPERPVVIHGVQHVFHPPAHARAPGRTPTTAPGWCSSCATSRRARSRTCSTRSSAPRQVDRPDRAALIDNPLVPFGGVDR